TVFADGRPTRLLADLEHKPWAAEDGEPWQVAFRCDVEAASLLDAELTVAPDITIMLPAPEPRRRARKKEPPAVGTRPLVPRDRLGAKGDPRAGERLSLLQREPQPRRDVISASGLAPRTRVPAEPQDEQQELKHQLEHAETEGADSAARLAELRGKFDDVRREREEAQRQRDLLAAERDASQRAREEAMRVSEGARSAHDQSLAERNAALSTRDQAVLERDAALVARDQAVSERDSALAARDRAVSERDS